MTDPYYQDDHCTIYHGDCVDLLDELTFDAVVTDPPYGINAEHRPHAKGHGKAAAWDESVPYEMLPRFGEIPVFWFGHPSKMAEAYATFDPTPDRVFIWAPKFTLSISARWGIAYRYTPIYSWRIGKQSPAVHDTITDRTECGNWWDHQATKPLSVMTKLVAMTDGIVLDPFMGSGSTIRAAKDLGRPVIGIEIEERYCEIAATRLGQEVLAFAD